MITKEEFEEIISKLNETLADEYHSVNREVVVSSDDNSFWKAPYNYHVNHMSKHIELDYEVISERYPYMDAEGIRKRLLDEIRSDRYLKHIFESEDQ